MLDALHPRPAPQESTDGPTHGRVPGDPERCRVSSTYYAARLLLEALEGPHNVDALAARLGCGRSFVAACTRRLLESGVWRYGETICEWREEGIRHPYFWNDVAVAEGILCRGPYGNGTFEWAPAGAWIKYSDAAEQAGYWTRHIEPPPRPAPPEDPIAKLFGDAQWLG